MSTSWIVHKFGGSSLRDADRFARVADILDARTDGPQQAVVVSAVGGVTDDLLNLVQLARVGDDSVGERLTAVRERHATIATALLPAGALRDRYLDIVAADCRDIADILRATRLLGADTANVRDLVSGFGEIWSAQLLASYLRHRRGEQAAIRWLDARDVLVVEHGELGPSVHWDQATERLGTQLKDGFAGTMVITGFIARSPQGVQTTLGRNGSDFSASIFGALLGASEINIWTDVPGVMSADPRLVSDAAVIDELSYDEAMELAYFGARVLHPQTMAPAVEHSIPLYIRDSGAPLKPGSRIGVRTGAASAVKGVTAIDGVALVNLEGAGMIGVPGTASRLFQSLRDAGISVVMISQGSSEHSICFAVREEQARSVRDLLGRAFAAELDSGQIQSVEVTHDCAILAVVGDGMAGTPGVSAKMFGSLGAAGINIRAIAQGSSERNISTVIDGSEAVRAVRAVHAGFYLSPQTLSLGLIGAGSVGREMLAQLASQHDRLRRDINLDIRLRAVATSRRMLLSEHPIPLDNWAELLDSAGEALDLERLVAHVQAEHLPHAVLVDCTASGDIAARYADWLARGIHVITPNKKANTADLEYYRRIHRERRGADAHYLYEATVGAGLPIVHTLRDLRETGDRISRIQGIFSGTLAYLFNLFDGDRPFSALVREAREHGYTEPDPRDDLSGMDVARKLVILGREMGLALELADVSVESLFPAALAEGDVETFLDDFAAYDGQMVERLERARSADEVLRYVGRLEADGRATVALESLPRTHAFANIALTDNIVLFETGRYCDNPLIVQGPGAGPAVTAGGVFADVLRLATYLGSSL